jgi:Flp pilus assembly protein TadD
MYTRLGAAHAMLGNIGESSAALERAIGLAPRWGYPVAWLGYVRFIAGDREGARALLQYALRELGPPDRMVLQVASLYVRSL